MFSSNNLFRLLATFLQSFILTTAECWRGTKCAGPVTAAFPGIWDQFNFSPASRIISPNLITLSFKVDHTLPFGTLLGNGSRIVYDFGKEVGGIIAVTYNATDTAQLGLAFSESDIWIGEWSDGSNGSFNPDGALYAEVTATDEAEYKMPLNKLRGGFRYLTIFEKAISNSVISILNITLEISFQPDWPNLRAYKGYFSCSDDLLTKIWYSGAYTLQTNAIPPTTGREFPILGSSWLNDADLSSGINGSTVYVDGSKRDRTVWSGDLIVALPSIFVSTGDWDGVKTTLDILYAGQTVNGELPFAGPQINIHGSDTYHMATLIGSYEYFLWTNDLMWLNRIYQSKFKPAMSFITNKIDNTSMLYVTGKEDWGRITQGGHNTEANFLLYKTLLAGARIAEGVEDMVQASLWSKLAVALKSSVNSNNFDNKFGAFKNSDIDASIHPQDANSLALIYNVSTPENTIRISDALTLNWISIGSLSPELPNNLVGFGQSLEIKGHLVANQALRALDLIRRAWGWYLNHPSGTASTCIEGYRADGSFGYRAETGYGGDYSYTSHAHGWSTGPTESLTNYIVGLTITKPAGQQWALTPQFADLTFAEAGFSTPLGKFSSKWELMDGGFRLSWDVPFSTYGTLFIPLSSNGIPHLVLDGKPWVLNEKDVRFERDRVVLPGIYGYHVLEATY